MSDQEYISVLEHGREADSRRIAELEADIARKVKASNKTNRLLIKANDELQALREAATKVYENSWMHKRDKPEAHEAMMAMGAALQEVKRD